MAEPILYEVFTTNRTTPFYKTGVTTGSLDAGRVQVAYVGSITGTITVGTRLQGMPTFWFPPVTSNSLTSIVHMPGEVCVQSSGVTGTGQIIVAIDK